MTENINDKVTEVTNEEAQIKDLDKPLDMYEVRRAAEHAESMSSIRIIEKFPPVGLFDTKEGLKDLDEVQDTLFPKAFGVPVTLEGVEIDLDGASYAASLASVVRGARHNQGKMRYDLIPPYPMEQIAKVMTKGAEKYAPHNWKKGMPWSEVMGSLERHYEAFKAGEDFDDETGLYHMAHVAVNAQFLIDYYRSNPQFDDRLKPYLNTRKIVLDIDEVLASWTKAYCERYGVDQTHAYWDFSYMVGQKLTELMEDEEFWINLPVKHRPNFVPHAYVSSRSIPVEWTRKFLEKNNLPCRPVYHVPFDTSKVEVLKSIGTEIFIDDRFENFAEAQNAGITSFLMDAPHNQHYNVGYRRVYDLDIKRIIW